MDKKKFIELINIEDNMEGSKLYDKFLKGYNSGIITYSDSFYPPSVWKRLQENEGSLGLIVETKGITERSERRMVAFIPYEEGGQEEFPVTSIRLSIKNKFKSLEHKHYLGNLLALGIKREKLSDLVVGEDGCYFLANKKIEGIIVQELKTINKNDVIIELEGNWKVPEPRFESINILSASLRLDGVVAQLIKGSRKESSDLINNLDVQVNYTPTGNTKYNIKEGDIISIRKNGKYEYLGIVKETKKGKLSLKLDKYI